MLKQIIAIVATGFIVASCQKEEGCTDPAAANYNADAEKDDNSCMYAESLAMPATYEFTRDGSSSVSYSGQTDRLNQLTEMKNLLKTADGGAKIEAQDLLDMFANTNDNGGDNFTFNSTKQLKNKTFELDRDWFETLMTNAAAVSDSGAANVMASNGKAGLVTRSNGNTILVDSNGWEFTQFIEKGLMGATFYYQVGNTYLTDEEIGDDVENTELEDGKNYTAMEHHWDEAFGYMNFPVDFESDYIGSGSLKYWGNYTNERDELLGSADILMNAYTLGRAAIVAKKYDIKNAQRDIIYTEFERVIAATAIHYMNEALSATNDGDRLHVLSEGYSFVRALRYAHPDHAKFTIAEIDAFLHTDIGNDLWNVQASGLNNVKNQLSTAYNLDGVKDNL